MSVTYSYTVSDEEDAAITARRLAIAPTIVDNATFVAKDIRENILGPVVAAHIEKRVALMADKYRAASAAERVAADSALAKVATVPPPEPKLP